MKDYLKLLLGSFAFFASWKIRRWAYFHLRKQLWRHISPFWSVGQFHTRLQSIRFDYGSLESRYLWITWKDSCKIRLEFYTSSIWGPDPLYVLSDGKINQGETCRWLEFKYSISVAQDKQMAKFLWKHNNAVLTARFFWGIHNLWPDWGYCSKQYFRCV